MKLNQIEILNSVATVNSNILSSVGESNYRFYSLLYETDGGESHIIKFMGITIWTSNNDARQYFSGKDEYESLFDYLVRQIFVVIKISHKLSIPLSSKISKNNFAVFYNGFSIEIDNTDAVLTISIITDTINRINDILNQVSFDEILIEDTKQIETVVNSENVSGLKLIIKSLNLGKEEKEINRFQNGLILLLNRIL